MVDPVKRPGMVFSDVVVPRDGFVIPPAEIYPFRAGKELELPGHERYTCLAG